MNQFQGLLENLGQVNNSAVILDIAFTALVSVGIGLLIVLFRSLSKIEMVTPFAIIIMNAIDHRCDAYGVGIIRFFKNCFSALKKSICLCGRLIARGAGKIWEWISLLLQKMVDGPKK